MGGKYSSSNVWAKGLTTRPNGTAICKIKETKCKNSQHIIKHRTAIALLSRNQGFST
jgi:hypothetical protein